MSSRALRKLQREQEEQKHLQSLAAVDASDASEENSPVAPRAKLNAFDMLEGVGAHENDEVDADEQDDEDSAEGDNSHRQAPILSEPPKTGSKPRKKKNKSKKKKTEKDPPVRGSPSGKGKASQEDNVDEIDRALQELATKQPAQVTQNGDHVQHTGFSEWEVRVSKLLAAEQKNLNPLNEMRSLFGSLAMEQENSPLDRRNHRPGDAVDLGTALLGRYSHASKGVELGALSAARNCFLQGKPGWPRTTSGGLSMELSSEKDNPIRRYHFVRNAAYQDIQAQFQICVESMQPERMIQLLQHNPYHVSTLLQVSEIAKHQGDHSVSTDLLERTLYTLGRSVHSTFSSALRDGRARVYFHHAANRELYLAIWRYISSLEMRGTWRTAFEWCKILLSFDIVSDPYGMTHFIDQLALRGRQHRQLIQLCAEGNFKDTWAHLPNISISLSLAHQRDSSPQLARQTLALAIKRYPYIICRLFSELDMNPPKSIWGSQPNTEAERLYTELYSTRAKDLWNTPETTSLLVEVAETLDHYDTSAASDTPKLEISLEDARHVMLTEKPSFIALLPRRYTNLPTSSSDPLPPPDEATRRDQYTERAPGATPSAGGGFLRLPGNLGGANWLGSVIDLFRGTSATDPEDAEPDNEASSSLTPSHPEAPNAADHAPPVGLPTSTRELANLIDAIEEIDAGIDTEFLENMEHIQGLPEEVRREIMHLEDTSENVERVFADIGSDGEARVGEVEEDAHAAEPASPAPPPPVPSTRPGHATVVDAPDSSDDDNDAAPSRPRNPAPRDGQPILRPTTPPRPPPPSTSTSTSTGQPQPLPPSSPSTSDPQRTQRYLLSTGLTNLQHYIAEHGTDPEKWPERNPEAWRDFVVKLEGLRAREREWVIRVLGQQDRRLGEVLTSRR